MYKDTMTSLPHHVTSHPHCGGRDGQFLTLIFYWLLFSIIVQTKNYCYDNKRNIFGLRMKSKQLYCAFLFYFFNPFFKMYGIYSTFIASTKASVRSHNELKKFLVFTFLYVCTSSDNGCKYFSIRLKFGINVYILCEVTWIIFSVYTAKKSVYRDI